MKLPGKKIGILIEGDFYENEIFYYNFRFPEEGAEVHFLSRLWGQSSLTFQGHELKAPWPCQESFESIDDEELATYSAIIVPSGMVADRLRYTEDLGKLPPAAEFLRRAFAQPQILKGIICHGLWLAAPVRDVVRGRRLVCHNNLHGDALAYGAEFVDEDVVVDGDLVTARSGNHCHLFARKIIEILSERADATDSLSVAEQLLSAAAR
ncbi:DJ-1/PfpI family protein [Candidatus Laterigemmans baculatus]|uniref:DJ-1/PfpI family protein n=1 Tax=Candidatus Laterigemmans baculatus TaxID=2770505 RepID=UPI0013DD7428|nr:DJ-1/PfpI family protein [Candidatus Laterigemmans baculatus]